jgi:hypothetical protein
MPHFTTSAACRSFLPCLLMAAALAAGPARAGGGPENLFLVVNPASADSLTVANAFMTARKVPPINVFMLPWQDGDETVTIARFRNEILVPIMKAIDSRRLASQIDYVVYSCDFPWRIDYAAELPPELAKMKEYGFPSGSLTGMTMLYSAVLSGGPAWLDLESNDYFRPPDADGIPPTTLGFRSWYGWSERGDLLEVGGNRYLLSVMLGVTAGRGNSVPEVVRYLQSAAAADGSPPQGTFYFMRNSDVRIKARKGPVRATVDALEKLGRKAEIESGTIPDGKQDVAGLMMGSPDFNWAASKSGLLPGAICDNLTSFGGVFTIGAGQTPISEFLRAGAAGASGTVIEPYVLIPTNPLSPSAFQAKFPHPALQLHYARGASLGEAFYQSVRSPHQLLVVGDPLCQPWAAIPEVEVVNAADSRLLEPGAALSGTVSLEPRSSMPEGRQADRFELFVDGMRVAQCGLGERLPLDTSALADGHHELRVVAIDASPLETQGRRIIPVTFANHERALTLTVEPRRVRPADTVRVSLSGAGVDGALIFAPGRVLGRTSAAAASIEVPAELLGRGEVAIRATGRAGPHPADGVNATPVLVEVTDAP